MTYWIDYGQGVREACESLVKARATAVRIIEGGVYGLIEVPIYASRAAKRPVGKVYLAVSGKMMWCSYTSEYGEVRSYLFKNGKLVR